MKNCSGSVTSNDAASCGGYRGQVNHTCWTYTLSVTVTAAINGSEVKCYNADRSVIGETDPLQPVGSARIQLAPEKITGKCQAVFGGTINVRDHEGSIWYPFLHAKCRID